MTSDLLSLAQNAMGNEFASAVSGFSENRRERHRARSGRFFPW